MESTPVRNGCKGKGGNDEQISPMLLMMESTPVRNGCKGKGGNDEQISPMLLMMGDKM
jgi:hypothetical protein